MFEPGTPVVFSADGPVHLYKEPQLAVCGEAGPLDRAEGGPAEECAACFDEVFFPIPTCSDEDLTKLAQAAINGEVLVRFNTEQEIESLMEYFGACLESQAKKDPCFYNSMMNNRIGACYANTAELKEVTFEDGEKKTMFLSGFVLGVADAQALLGKIIRFKTLSEGVPSGIQTV